MRKRSSLSKFAAMVAVVGALAMTGTSTAGAHVGTAPDEAAQLACGGGVFLDGIRALEATSDPGARDEVKILNAAGAKVWPTTADSVSMGANQRIEVDKCVPVGSRLSLIEVDDFAPDDNLGGVHITQDVTRDHEFCCGEGRYRIGVLA